MPHPPESKCRATRYINDLAGDPAAVIRGQEGGDISHVIRLPDTRQHRHARVPVHGSATRCSFSCRSLRGQFFFFPLYALYVRIVVASASLSKAGAP